MDCDTNQNALFEDLPRLIAVNREAIEREMAEMASWFESGDKCYHVYKMVQAEQYALWAVR